MTHHNIKYASMLIMFYFKIINNENKTNFNVKRQIIIKLNKISNMKIHKTSKVKKYIYELSKHGKYKKENNNEYIITHNEIHILNMLKYNNELFNIIYDTIINVQQKIKNKNINLMCTYECIILHYLLSIVDNGNKSDITIDEIYNITNVYCSKTLIYCEHNDCKCRELFKIINLNEINNVDNTNKITNINKYQYKNKNIDYYKLWEDDLTNFEIATINNNKNTNDIINNNEIENKKYLNSHYEKIKNIDKIYDNFLMEYPNINWLSNHKIKITHKNDDLKLYKKFNIIGYEEKNVFIVYLKPELNNLNYNEILLDSIYELFTLNCVLNIMDITIFEQDNKYNKTEEDYKKFYGKNNKIVIFSLNENNYHIIDWKNEDNENLIIKNKNLIVEELKNKIIDDYKNECKNVFYFFQECLKEFINNDDDAIKIIDYIIDCYNLQVKDSGINFPSFILDFFKQICDEIKRNICKHKKNILDLFNDEEIFFNGLNTKIKDKTELYNKLKLNYNIDVILDKYELYGLYEIIERNINKIINDTFKLQ
jgi:hypothetical protein